MSVFFFGFFFGKTEMEWGFRQTDVQLLGCRRINHVRCERDREIIYHG